VNDYGEDLSDNIEECDCANCKSVFWVPYFRDLPDIGHPQFCPFCGVEFGWIEERV
jgi:hypothetical protein